MRHRTAAYLAAAWAITFAAPHMSWATGRKDGLGTALRCVEEHALPLETARAQVACGQPSAVNRLLVLKAEPYPGRGTVLLLRQAIGF